MDASTPDSLHHGAMPAGETYGQQLMLILTLSTEPDSINVILVSARYCLILHFRWKTTGPGRVWFLPSPNVQKDIERLNDSQPTVLEELINSEEISFLPKSVPLMSSKEYVKLRKTKCVLRYHVPNNITKPEAYAHHMLFMFYPFRKEDSLKKTDSGTYSEKLLELGVIDIINENKRICEPYGELEDDAFLHFSENNANGLDPNGEQENESVRD